VLIQQLEGLMMMMMMMIMTIIAAIKPEVME
jgi:hypothetical protein